MQRGTGGWGSEGCVRYQTLRENDDTHAQKGSRLPDEECKGPDVEVDEVLGL